MRSPAVRAAALLTAARAAPSSSAARVAVHCTPLWRCFRAISSSPAVALLALLKCTASRRAARVDAPPAAALPAPRLLPRRPFLVRRRGVLARPAYRASRGAAFTPARCPPACRPRPLRSRAAPTQLPRRSCAELPFRSLVVSRRAASAAALYPRPRRSLHCAARASLALLAPAHAHLLPCCGSPGASCCVARASPHRSLPHSPLPNTCSQPSRCSTPHCSIPRRSRAVPSRRSPSVRRRVVRAALHRRPKGFGAVRRHTHQHTLSDLRHMPCH